MASFKSRINQTLGVYEPLTIVAGTIAAIGALYAGCKIASNPKGSYDHFYSFDDFARSLESHVWVNSFRIARMVLLRLALRIFDFLPHVVFCLSCLSV